MFESFVRTEICLRNKIVGVVNWLDPFQDDGRFHSLKVTEIRNLQANHSGLSDDGFILIHIES